MQVRDPEMMILNSNGDREYTRLEIKMMSE